jgi:chitin deacetylase
VTIYACTTLLTKCVFISIFLLLLGPKKPGLIVLEHEIKNITVGAFMLDFSMIGAFGWDFVSLAQALGRGSSYANAQNSSTNDVTLMPIVPSIPSTPSLPVPSTSSSSGTSPSGNI